MVLLLIIIMASCALVSQALNAASLNVGADLCLKARALSNPDFKNETNDHLNYTSQRLRLYLESKPKDNFEFNLWAQGITPWGLAGSTSIAKTTRYPSADGSLWIEQAYVMLQPVPDTKWPLTLSVGRQPYIMGDGFLVSDDTLGFDGVSLAAGTPWKIDGEIFTAKARENLTGQSDKDLNIAIIGYDKQYTRLEAAYVAESDKTGAVYTVPATGNSVSTSEIKRSFYDFRLKGDLKDAYYKLEYALQNGSITQPNGQGNFKLSGSGFVAGVGGRADSLKFGKAGAYVEWAEGSGDDPSTAEDESFRPTYSRRWNGLERIGYGNLFAATVSDAFPFTTPFDTEKRGLPAGASGIQTLALKLDAVPHPDFTVILGFYTYKARSTQASSSKLGSELDMGLEYRLYDNLHFSAGFNNFVPAEAFGQAISRVREFIVSASCKY